MQIQHDLSVCQGLERQLLANDGAGSFLSKNGMEMGLNNACMCFEIRISD